MSNPAPTPPPPTPLPSTPTHPPSQQQTPQPPNNPPLPSATPSNSPNLTDFTNPTDPKPISTNASQPISTGPEPTASQPISTDSNQPAPPPKPTDSKPISTDSPSAASAKEGSDQLTTLAAKYSINTQKPHFPVNTLRLYYLILVAGLTDNNQKALDQTNTAIPKISALLNAHDRFIARKPPQHPAEELTALTPQIQALTQTVSTPLTRYAINQLFTYTYPLQAKLLITLDTRLQEPTLTPNDLHTALHIRAMDSILYSTIITEIINQHSPDPIPGSRSMAEGQAGISRDQKSINKPLDHQQPTIINSSLHFQINLASQINDLCDAVVYAKQDLQANAATLINIIQKATPDANEAVKLINLVLQDFLKKNQAFPLPPSTQPLTQTFLIQLTQVITNPPSQ